MNLRLIRHAITFAMLFAAADLSAQTVAANRTIRARTIIAESDLKLLAKTFPDAFSQPQDLIGLEAKVILYPGRPIRPGDVGPPAVIERNQIVTLVYRKGTLLITAEGRALARGGVGDQIRVMNLASRSTLTGTVSSPGEIQVE